MSLQSSLSASPEQELLMLQRFKQASDLHDGLMMAFLSMVTRSSGTLLLRSMLRQTLESFAKLTGAEESSFFWLDSQGYVTESILARGIAIREQRDSVVGQVLERGLAGWVYRKREIGVITDTANDDRWLELPYQPYVAKSIVCFPIIRGVHLLAIATLMHSEVGFFDAGKVQLVELCASRVAMVLDLLRIRVEELEKQETAKEMVKEPLKGQETQPQFLLSEVGNLILSDQGQVIYADPRLMEIFGFGTVELKGLQSFLNLVAESHREAFAKRFAQCFESGREELLLSFRGIGKDNRAIKLEFHGRLAKMYGHAVVVACVRALP